MERDHLVFLALSLTSPKLDHFLDRGGGRAKLHKPQHSTGYLLVCYLPPAQVLGNSVHELIQMEQNHLVLFVFIGIWILVPKVCMHFIDHSATLLGAKFEHFYKPCFNFLSWTKDLIEKRAKIKSEYGKSILHTNELWAFSFWSKDLRLLLEFSRCACHISNYR